MEARHMRSTFLLIFGLIFYVFIGSLVVTADDTPTAVLTGTPLNVDTPTSTMIPMLAAGQASEYDWQDTPTLEEPPPIALETPNASPTVEQPVSTAVSELEDALVEELAVEASKLEIDDDSTPAPAYEDEVSQPADIEPAETAAQASLEGAAEEPEYEREDVKDSSNADRDETIIILLPETSCRMDITDLGDGNPFTFGFNAVQANHIESFLWSFGDGGTATTQSALHTYSATGTFDISLTCTPLPGFGPPIVLTGSIFVSSIVTVDFDLTPGNMFTALPPVTVSTVNTSTGGALQYQWAISTSSNPADPAFFTSTNDNISYTFTSAEIASYPATFYFHLTATDGAGVSGYAMRSVVFNAPPPLATFNRTPATGQAPLTVAVEGVDLGEGPITTWLWDFDGDDVIDATGPGPHTYTYSTVGTYSIKLSYAGPGGAGEVVKQVAVFPEADPVQALFTYELRGAVSGGFLVCFTNNSIGPVATSEWDFDGDNIFDRLDNSSEVCHVYPTEGVFTARLRVSNADGTSTSTASSQVSVVAPPVAAFTVVPGTNITWGNLINLIDASSGVITSWEWDFDGDSVTDSTVQNPTNVALTRLGANPIRLTVTGPGGTSFVEVIVSVARLEITCDFTGALQVLPGAGPQTYNSIIGNQGGRTIDYAWTVTGSGAGLPATFTTPNISIDWASIGFGSYQVLLEASTSDGSTCSQTRTVSHLWPPLDCQMSSTLPATVYPNGNSYTFNANVQNLSGRSVIGYRWYINDVLQAVTGPSLTWTAPTDTSLSYPIPVSVRYEVDVDNGMGYAPPTSSCQETRTFNVDNWPTLVCSGISGPANPLPTTPDAPTRSHTYQANIDGVAGRTVTYVWTMSDGTIVSQTDNSATVRWNPTAASLSPAPQDDAISVIATVVNPDGTSAWCSMTRNVAVTLNRLQCNLPSGDTTVVVGETELYTRNLSNVYGRTITAFSWQIQQLTPVTSDTTSTDHPLSLTFDTPGATYRIRYFASVAGGDLPSDSCTSSWLNIAVYAGGVNFQCESDLTGNASPANPASTYPYTITMDNGNNIALRYRYVLTDYLGSEYVLATTTSTAHGAISSPAFTLDQLGPLGVDNYTLRVEVSAVDPDQSTHTCQRSLPLTVGATNVSYSYDAGGWTNTAVPIGQPICFTNTSNPVPGTINTLNYTWAVSGDPAANSLGIGSHSGVDLPGCLTFNQPGSYTVTLHGVNNSGLRSQTQMLTFNVYGLQSILINRSGSAFAPSTQSFSALGTNITGGYSWQFLNLDTGTSVGTGSGQNVSRFFSAPGRYRATVTGNGPLGATTASLDFTLLAPDGLTAGFTASQYGGVAPMTVCFTDTSISGSPITLWEWDFDGDGTFDLVYTPSEIPAGICHTYSEPGRVYLVRLRVTNANFTDTATNTIRTYTQLEQSSTFTITPQGGGSYCFTAVIPLGVTVTGWDFGDGAVGSGQNQVCHVYTAAGSYVVSMNIRQGETTGTVVRTVVVNPSSGPAPSFTVAASCSAERVASFVVTNTGGAMTTPDQVTIRNADGEVVSIQSMLLGAGQQATFSVSNQSGTVTFETVDFALSASTTCFYPPEINVSAVCNGSLPVFTISNNRPSDGPMVNSQDYEIRNGQGALIASGSFQLGIGESSVDVPIPAGNNPYETYTFISDGPVGTFTIAETCAVQPALSVSSQCASPVTFTVRNDGGDMVAAQAYTIASDEGIVVEGTFQLAAGEEVAIALPAEENPYAPYQFVTFGFAGDLIEEQQCAAPVLSISSQCASPVTFTVRNDGGDMVAAQAYTIAGDGGTVRAATFQLAAGEEVAIALPAEENPYASYQFVTSGFAGDLVEEQQCAAPALMASAVCADPRTFTVTNTGAAMLSAQSYTVTNAEGETVVVGEFQLPQEESVTVTLSDLDPYATYMLTSDGFAGAAAAALGCERPQLVVTGDCLDPVVFVVTNEGGDMLASQNYVVTTSGGESVLMGALQLLHAEQAAIVLHGFEPRANYIFETDGFHGAASFAQSCAPAPVQPEVPTSSPVEESSNALTEAQLNQSQTIPLALTLAPFAGLSPAFEQGASAATCARGCPVFRVYHTNETGNWDIFRLDGANAETRETFRRNLSHGIGENVRSIAPSLSPNNEWVVFASDRDGNWEIYVASTSGDPASVQRVTFNQVAIDTNPVWGPNNIVVFETTRNGVWDLYAIDMSSGQQYPLVASEWNDISPYWSPDGSRLIFQSDRPDETGERKWQIYVLDLASGGLTRLSDGSSIDVDPQYSNDGSRIVYRTYAEADGRSAIALMDADGRNKRTISDAAGDATNPAWSPRDRYIAYQSDLDGDLDIYIYEVATGRTRHLTDNEVQDYAPTWACDETRVIFTSDVDGSPDIYEMPVQPITDGPLPVENVADQLTFELFNDVYPQSSPLVEFASREGQTVIGDFGEQTVFLMPDASVTPPDLSIDGAQREDWRPPDSCVLGDDIVPRSADHRS
ncbi:MAG: PKD domain-containing protein [Aggregatilineales bacterium]